MTPASPTRKRDAAATRAAILRAAQSQFASHGYEEAGLRDIAAEVGINVALVVRYFGSKEQLFAESIAGRFAVRALLDVPRAQLGETLARYVLHKEDNGALDPFLILLHSASHVKATSFLRRQLQQEFVQPLADLLGGEAAAMRAGLIAASLSGLTLTRHVLRLDALTADDLSPDNLKPLVAWVARTLQTYIDGDVTGTQLT